MEMNRIRFSIILLLIIFTIKTEAQYKLFNNMGESAFVSIKTRYGQPIQYSDSLKNSINFNYTNYDFRFGIESFDRCPQDSILGFSTYGLGISKFSGIGDSIGNPMAFYGFYNFPMFQRGRIKWKGEIAAGLGFNFNEFNIVTNPKNDIIGLDRNLYFNLSSQIEFKLSERIDIVAALDLIHFSNGWMSSPNKGLNLYGIHTGVKYFFQYGQKNVSPFIRKNHGKLMYSSLKPYQEFSIWLSGGEKTTMFIQKDPAKYFCSTLSFDFNKAYTHISKWGLGGDVIYDATMNAYPPMTKDSSQLHNLFLSVHVGHEFTVSNLSLYIQSGYYIWKGIEAKGRFFLRTGLRYRLGKHYFINLSVKTVNGFKADYIELGLGYRFKFKKNRASN